MGALTATDVPVAVAAASLMKQNNPHVYMRVFGGLTARKDRAVASLDRKGPPLLGKLYSSIIKDLQDSFKF